MPNKKSSYTKPHLTILKQIEQLKSRGMQFADIKKAEHYLEHINYYRLTAYWLPYEANHQTHTFRPNTFFEEILKYYVFDRELRLLVLDAIERIEVSIRTKMAYILTEKYASHPHLHPEVFHCPVKYGQNISTLSNVYVRSDETFSTHFKNKYVEKIPPMWVAIELTTLGQTSHWYGNIKLRTDRRAISTFYGLDDSILKSYLHHLKIIRNICAHHSRLWNKRFTFSIKLPKSPTNLSESMNKNPTDIKSLYNTLVFLKYFMDQINPNHQWDIRLKKLLNNIHIQSMGFPKNWETKPLWQ